VPVRRRNGAGAVQDISNRFIGKYRPSNTALYFAFSITRIPESVEHPSQKTGARQDQLQRPYVRLLHPADNGHERAKQRHGLDRRPVLRCTGHAFCRSDIVKEQSSRKVSQ